MCFFFSVIAHHRLDIQEDYRKSLCILNSRQRAAKRVSVVAQAHLWPCEFSEEDATLTHSLRCPLCEQRGDRQCVPQQSWGHPITDQLSCYWRVGIRMLNHHVLRVSHSLYIAFHWFWCACFNISEIQMCHLIDSILNHPQPSSTFWGSWYCLWLHTRGHNSLYCCDAW